MTVADLEKTQLTMQDPRTQYPAAGFPEQSQKAPGLAKDMIPQPDHGETTYQGLGRLQGRKAVVTGGDSGIGRATAIAFAREGADVTFSYLPSEEPDAQEVIQVLEATGQKITPVAIDLSHEEGCKSLIDTAMKEMGGIDILANIAGMQRTQKSIQDITSEQFDATFRTNVYGMFWLCKHALPHMPPGASIINTTSIQSYQPSSHLLDYASTKAAIKAFTEALSAQAIEQGVRVNAVAPGPIWTPLQPAEGQPPEKLPKFGLQTPMKRPGQPAEVAPVYVFLASQEASYITGETFGVTGGEHTQ
jgi:NAD(P)-dependent dehydrogenase (short-subunit alcohol dehydrogenase family)